MGNCSSTAEAVAAGDSERISALLGVLSDRRRRFALRCLYEYETPMTIADVTDELVRRERGTDPANVPDARDRVYAQLYHLHLPKLAEVDAVALDLHENMVRLGPVAAELRPFPDAADEHAGLPALSESVGDDGCPDAAAGRRKRHSMSKDEREELAVTHLYQALETAAGDEKDYHVREALQLLSIDGEE